MGLLIANLVWLDIMTMKANEKLIELATSLPTATADRYTRTMAEADKRIQELKDSEQNTRIKQLEERK